MIIKMTKEALKQKLKTDLEGTLADFEKLIPKSNEYMHDTLSLLIGRLNELNEFEEGEKDSIKEKTITMDSYFVRRDQVRSAAIGLINKFFKSQN